MSYGDLTGPSAPSHEVRFEVPTPNTPIYFTVTAQGQDADPADLDAAVQKFVDLVAGTAGFTFRSASKSGTYEQTITPTGGA